MRVLIGYLFNDEQILFAKKFSNCLSARAEVHTSRGSLCGFYPHKDNYPARAAPDMLVGSGIICRDCASILRLSPANGRSHSKSLVRPYTQNTGAPLAHKGSKPRHLKKYQAKEGG